MTELSDTFSKLIAGDTRLTHISELVGALVRERNLLMAERSALLARITYAERLAYEKWLMNQAAAPLDGISATRAKR